ncbi:HD-GYP domain-containing protein [Caldicellulosiruptoraceae bacterium PP1]
MNNSNGDQSKYKREIIVFFLLAIPFVISVISYYYKNGYFPLINIISTVFLISYCIYFYFAYYESLLTRYIRKRKELMEVIDNLKSEKSEMELSMNNMSQLNKEMTDVLDRLLQNQNELKEKNEQLLYLFNISHKISYLTNIDEIVGVITKESNYKIDYQRICFMIYNSKNYFDNYYFFGKQDQDETNLIKQANNERNIAFKMLHLEDFDVLKVAIPVLSGQSIDGVIYFRLKTTYKYNESIEYILSLLNLIVIAINNARNYKNVLLQKNEIEKLYEETELINEKLKETIIQLNNSKKELEIKNKQLEDYYYDTILALSKAIEYKDEYTKGHCERVMKIADKIAEELNLSQQDRKDLRIACLLHDIGKIGIDENILNKKEKLSIEEFNEIKRHPELGFDLLKDLDFMERIKNIVVQHHERVDGKGYPRGLKDNEINVLAKIISIADAYDAMTSDRPYRHAFSKEQALNEIVKNAGKQFDKTICDVFSTIIKKGFIMIL